MRFGGKFLLALVAVVALGAAYSADAMADTITFHEVGGPTGDLTSQTFYGDLSFTNATQFGVDSRLPDDGYGITNSPNTSMTVTFLNGTNSASFTWATAGTGVNFHAYAYDSGGNLVDSYDFSAGSTTGSQNGTATLTGAISYIVFSDGGAQIAIDTLTYNAVPEPASLALLGLGMGAIVVHRRRKSKVVS